MQIVANGVGGEAGPDDVVQADQQRDHARGALQRDRQLFGADVSNLGPGGGEQLQVGVEVGVERATQLSDPRLRSVQLDPDALSAADAVAQGEKSHAARTASSASPCAARNPSTVAAQS
ncbi:MAG TPA: hypothetical protein VE442_06830 [Jatrophihabitans sp.]|nr:hypothetical protein [Jatrophihabitans sp.]